MSLTHKRWDDIYRRYCPPSANMICCFPRSPCPERSTTNNESWVCPLPPSPPSSRGLKLHISSVKKPAEVTNPSGCLEEALGSSFLGLLALSWNKLLGSSSLICQTTHLPYKTKPTSAWAGTGLVRQPDGLQGELERGGDSEQGLVPQTAQFGILTPSPWDLGQVISLLCTSIYSSVKWKQCYETKPHGIAIHVDQKQSINGNFIWFTLIVLIHGVIRKFTSRKMYST